MKRILTDAERARVDDRPDGRFYDSPRFVTHADEAFLERLTGLYETVLEPGDDVLDLMGSWVSHLPDVALGRVVGHGLNADELAANDRLTEWVVRDLNEAVREAHGRAHGRAADGDRERAAASGDPRVLPFETASLDAVLCALSVQYLQYPTATFAAVARVLRPGGMVVVSFSDRMFPTKAVRGWRERTREERLTLVADALAAAGLTVTDRVHEPRSGGDAFCAVVARAAADGG